ncbi:mRNA turnover protein 4 [Chionoecetes opilio]|uniref:Ribosome assembly factor mrt4 n=1 Tax=Chionoecetes opilio TaxID=41210 RepID=A0A8J8WN16_CHIOP|nr:mRNA turnover protein 4 [Chionoecetes opilio]
MPQVVLYQNPVSDLGALSNMKTPLGSRSRGPRRPPDPRPIKHKHKDGGPPEALRMSYRRPDGSVRRRAAGDLLRGSPAGHSQRPAVGHLPICRCDSQITLELPQPQLQTSQDCHSITFVLRSTTATAASHPPYRTNRTRQEKCLNPGVTKRKKGLDFKQNLVEEIRKCIDLYARVFVFSARHIKTSKLKEIRVEWSRSRFFLGKNKVMALALGRTPEEEIQENLHRVSQRLVGQCGILFTNASKEEVMEYFENRKYPVPPHAGDVASETVELEKGLLPQFSHAIEPRLRKLGMPTRLERGVPELLQDFTVSEEGRQLTPAQANILTCDIGLPLGNKQKLLGKEMAFFQLQMDWCWSRLDGKFECLQENAANKKDSEEHPRKT